MFLIKCLPIAKSLNKDFLSYFSKESIEKGSLIKVSVRKKNVKALVIECTSIREAKTELRKALYSLKKVTSITSKNFLSKKYLDAIQRTSEYYGTSMGQTLYQLIPAPILENTALLSTFNKKGIYFSPTKSDTNLKYVMQDNTEERFGYFKSLIREEFAKKNSLFICLSQNEDIKQTKEILERGIEKYVATFHKEMTRKDFQEEWKKASNQKHPVVIIATPRWLFIPRDDIKTIVIEKENSEGWKTISRPFLDIRVFSEIYAEEIGAKIIFSDTFLRVDTLYRHKQGELQKFEQVKWRLDLKEDICLINNTDIKYKIGEFKALSSLVIKEIEKSIKSGQNVFVYTTRKGLSPVTICNDCGHYVLCNNCKSPMVLYTGKGSNNFKCHQCGEMRDATEKCAKCGSWNLVDLGIGFEKVKKEIQERFEHVNIFELNKDLKINNTKATKIVENFYNTKNSILIGTEFALSYLNKKIGTIVISSLDSLFSIPDFRIREKIFRIMIQCRNLSKGKLIIQTRNLSDVSIESIVDGNLLSFYNQEISERKILDYPPFGLFIKLTTRGTLSQVSKSSEIIKEMVKEYNLDDVSYFSSSHEKKGEQKAFNVVIKVQKDTWPNQEILNFLRLVPPNFELKIDPDNLL